MRKVASSLALIFALTLSIGMTAPTAADPQTCEPLCITSNCSQNSDCTAEPNGHCSFVCPQHGCCVYN